MKIKTCYQDQGKKARATQEIKKDTNLKSTTTKSNALKFLSKFAF